MYFKCSIMHHNLPISKENGDINIYLNNLDIIQLIQNKKCLFSINFILKLKRILHNWQ